MNTSHQPKRGEIWLVDFEPRIGSEPDKERPAVVVSSDVLGRLPLKLVVPLTGWQCHFENTGWHVRIKPDSANRIDKESAIDIFMMRTVDLKRFKHKIGIVPMSLMQEIAATIASVVEYE